MSLLAWKLDKKAVVVGGHSFKVELDSVVAGYVWATAHAPAAGTDLHSTSGLRLHQHEKMSAVRASLRQDGRGGTGPSVVAAVAEVEDGEVESLTGPNWKV